MSRFAKIITLDQLAEKIIKAIKTSSDIDYHNEYEPGEVDESNPLEFMDRFAIYMQDLTEQITKDLSKVEFDSENAEIKDGYCHKTLVGLKTLSNGMPYLGISAGGDWEWPIFYIVYWDGSKLRGYVPTEGNAWNKQIKKAFGNDRKRDVEYLKSIDPKCELEENTIDYGNCDAIDKLEDTDKIIADIMDRIKIKP